MVLAPLLLARDEENTNEHSESIQKGVNPSLSDCRLSGIPTF